MPTGLPTETALPTRDASHAGELSAINRELAEKRVAAAARAARLPYVNLQLTTLKPDLAWKLDLEKCEAAEALPFFQIGKHIRVAVADLAAEATQKFLADYRAEGYECQLNLASSFGIAEKIAELRASQPRQHATYENRDAEADVQTAATEVESLQTLPGLASSLSAEDLLNRIFVGALRARAHDIHLQPGETGWQLRLRIDGLLRVAAEFDAKTGTAILEQLKYEARLQLNTHNKPQDGRTAFRASGRQVDVRVSTLPTEYGESAVCRLLDRARGLQTLEQLGFADGALRALQHALNRRDGLLLVTGPTGSGKTTTLYTMLGQLNQPESKLATLEDPVEYRLPGVAQSQINEPHGYTFAGGLRALLRQDPDVILVGEIRDHETAETAAQAAMTGHVVLSTLHTNSAIEAVSRLINIGLPPYMLASSLALAVAQRLVRQLCPQCAQKTPVTDFQREILEFHLKNMRALAPADTPELPAFLPKPVGCPACDGSGYRGQLAVVEAVFFDEPLREQILAGRSSAQMLEGVRTRQHAFSLVEDGIAKVCRGQTTLAELARITEIRPNSN